VKRLLGAQLLQLSLEHDDPRSAFEAKVEKSFSVLSDPHAGHIGELSDALAPTSSSKMCPHPEHLYSYNGMD
jgi:hypothetical protein